MNLATIVFVAGLLLGALILLAVLRVYMEKKAFGVGDASFASLGVVLMGLSVFTSVSVTVSATELKAQFDTVKKQMNEVTKQSAVLERRVATVAESSGTLSEGLANMGEKLNQGETTVAQLTDALQRSRAVPPEAAERIRSSARTTPQIDVQRYRNLSQELRRVPAP